jgi:hypothetical protein
MGEEVRQMLPRQQKSTEICSFAAGRWSSVIFEE